MSHYELIDIATWAESVFPNERYCKNTLSHWAKTKQIFPPPVKVGRKWKCERDARFVGLTDTTQSDITDPLVERIFNHGSQT
ncbi:excisionase [Vibrio penaeicida]|uniref:Excisionase n=1 Tax=Vibrio penaeicida TaxID=104609 RepID=A0AAV5NQX5_9VIBR|nr:excisionase [Vibrio penaeicida]RTZ24291.1 hypothetical protein EKN09_04445 [Vibrio penaeicida]GLQ72883.1 excisionase [Vibrio penaeicida]